MKFTLFGIEIEISFLFTAMLAVIAATDKSGSVFLFFIAAAIHEAAHLLIMLCLKSKPSAIRLIAGGINIVDNNPNTFAEDILILLAGPLSNLICALVFKGEFADINLLMFFFNLLIIKGLDGGRLLEILLSKIFSQKTTEKTLNIITLSFSIIIFFLFLFLLMRGVKNYSFLTFSLYLFSTYFCKKGIERND